MNPEEKKIYGLIGYPVKHSFSPAMHNAAFRALKINAVYKLFEKKPEELKGFFASLDNQNIRGLNVTIPYKEKVLAYLDDQSEEVKTIGATNTIIVDKHGRLKGFNTDYLGFWKHLLELKLRPKRVAIIGAGGAALAVCFALAKNKVEEVFIYDINKDKNLNLAERFQGVFPESQFLAVNKIEDLEIKNKDLLVNASPVGMKPQDSCLLKARLLHANLFVYDLIYNPQETRLLRLAKTRGCRYANGLGMLLYQGVESLRVWIKPKKVPLGVMRKALREELYK